MRRKDREMSYAFALELIDRLPYATLSTIDKEGNPYGIPLSIIRHEKALYFHSAKAGKKVEAFETTKNVCLTFVGEVNIPELFSSEELEEFSKDKSKGATLISKVFTTEFESAIVQGEISLVEDKAEAIEAMRRLCKKYTPNKMGLFDLAIETGLKRTHLFKITMNQVTAKRKKFDSSGEELKWQRKE